MDIEVKVSIGATALEYRGESDFFLEHIKGYLDQVNSALTNSKPTEIDGKPTKLEEMPAMTVKAVASKFSAASGPELALASLAQLGIIEGRETISRRELLEAMRSAVGYFKPSYASNLSKIIGGLEKEGIIIEIGKEKYSIGAPHIESMRTRLHA